MLKDMTKVKSTKISKEVFYDKISNEIESESENNNNVGNNTSSNAETVENEAKEYNYLLGMPMWSLTFEKVEELKKQVGEKEQQLL